MHTPGIIGLPRRIFDYPTVYFRFHRLQSFGIIGIALPSAVSMLRLLFIALFIFYGDVPSKHHSCQLLR